jgi:general secretion pathway protein D
MSRLSVKPGAFGVLDLTLTRRGRRKYFSRLHVVLPPGILVMDCSTISVEKHLFSRRSSAAWLVAIAVMLACWTTGRAEDVPAPEPAGNADADAARRVIAEAISRSESKSEEGASQRQPSEAKRPQVDSVAIPKDLVIAKISAEVAAKQLEAKRTAQRSAADALRMLDAVAAEVARLDIPAEARGQLERRIERTRRDIEESTGKRRAEIALDQKNEAIEAQIDRERGKRIEVDQRLAMLVEEYNVLVDERRFPEAEAIAKKAAQLAPDNPVVRQLLSQSRMIRRLDAQRSIEGVKQAGFLDVAEDSERSSAPFVGPIAFPETKDWEDLTKNRSRLEAEGRSRSTPAEVAIQKKLSVQVKAVHRNEPLAAVLDALAKQADVPIHLDMVGLAGESVRSDTPVTIQLDQPISLKSVLKLILEPLHLDYTIQDEVLKITSPRLAKGEVYSVSYQVADLVVPIPNFSSEGLGITGALRDGYSRISSRNALTVETGPVPAGINGASKSPANAAVDPTSLAQFQGGMNGPPATGSNPSIPFGPPTVGGNQADFQSLIDLIQNTVAPQTWNTVGGQGAIQPFPTNLSIVVSQTQEVHEEIANLLEQLRRLQDLQVTIEVRFISLNDTFFERIGVDFDFNIQTNVSEPLNMTAVPTQGNSSTYPGSLGITAAPGGPSQTIGLDNTGNPGVARSGSATGRDFYSIPFRQNSFGSATVPSLPGLPDPGTSAANFGFAILSDIEAYFLIQAAQGNTRSNVMQAPKVTLFNGQNAFVSDTRQRPFVTSVVPVVGDFAAAQQPVITVLSEGTAVNVQAVVSSDRRFVRLTLVPFFSTIGAVQEFQFEGSRSTTTKSSDEKSGLSGDANAGQDLQAGLTTGTKNAREQQVRSNGTTIQLPEFLFTTVTTTVSVPDGGTVLLGGIKRLREGRNEFGVPILSKIPYINRLFKNVGLGRTTDSLMLMVTPRIIIQEEEEDKLLGANRP